MDGPGISLFQGGESIQINTSGQREEEEDFLEEEGIRKAELQVLLHNAFDDLDEDHIDTDSSIASSRSSRSRFSHGSSLRSHNTNDYSVEYAQRSPIKSQQEPVRDSGNFRLANQKVPFKVSDNHYNDNHFRESTHISSHQNHCFHNNSPIVEEEKNRQTEMYKHCDLNGADQLKVLYDVRLREIERLTKELEAEKEEKIQILRKLALSEHDKKNLEISLNANKTLLDESRAKISDLEGEITKLQSLIKEIEKSKNEVRSELEITKTQLYHEQQKFAALERSDLGMKREKQMDLVIDSLKSKHQSEIIKLQRELDSIMERYNKKEQDFNALEKKLIELEEKHSAQLFSKCDSVLRQDSTIQTLLEEANREKLEMARQINTLQQECAQLKIELEQYDTLPSFKLTDNASSDEKESDSFLLMSSTWRSDSKRKSLKLNHVDMVNKLKEELHRALISQRAKRKEIMKLQEQVQAKELQITSLKEQERTHISQLEALQGNINKFRQHIDNYKQKEAKDIELLTKLQSDIITLEEENTKKTEKIRQLEKEIETYKERLTTANQVENNKYLEEFNKEITKIKFDSEQLLKDKELEWGREMEKILTECDDLKKLYLEIKNDRDELAKKLDNVTKMCEELQLQKTHLESQLSDKVQYIKDMEDRIQLLEKDKGLTKIESHYQMDLNEIVEKQNNEISFLKSKLQEAAKSDEELNNLKQEIENSKLRYLELEKTLREEFQENMVKLQEENSTLKETLNKKEAELSLRKMCITSQKREISVATEDALLHERTAEQQLSEIDNLEKEISRLRSLVEAKTQEILKLTSSQERKINEVMQQLEKKLSEQHQKEILLAEEKIKDLTMKSFSLEIEKLQIQHTENLKAVRAEDYKQIEELRHLLAKKDEELRQLNSKKESLEGALEKYEEERLKAAHIMTQWAKEVEAIKKEKENLAENMEKLKLSNSQIYDAYEKLNEKLKETKKTALVYKKRWTESKTSLAEKYNNIMIDFQKKVDEVISAKELEVKEILEKIENEYKSRERHLQDEEKNIDVT